MMNTDAVTNAKLADTLTQVVADYLQFTRSLGFKYVSEENVLSRFLKMSLSFQIVDGYIPDRLLEEWFSKRSCEKSTTFKSRCFCIARFLSYARDYGYIATIPDIPRIKAENYIPYIFNEAEIACFFHACDSLPPYTGSSRHEIAPVLFRLLYSCGLRATEASTLKMKDVDLEQGVLIIRNPKNLKDRYVPMSDSLTKELRIYHTQAHDSSLCGEDFFFRSKYNDHITRVNVYKWFRLCLDRAGIPHRGKGYGPREHDLRHTFCVHSLKSMVDQGMDIYTCLPILSTYVGHKSIQATQQYLRLTAEMYPNLLAQVTEYAGNAIPQPWEVDDDETD